MNKSKLPKTLDLDISADDIAKGRHEDCLACPITKAIMRRLQIVVKVYDDGIYTIKNKMIYMPIFDDHSEFVNGFDAKKPVEPISIQYVKV